MAEPIDPDELERIVRSGSFTSRELAQRLKRRHGDVRDVLKREWRFVATRDGRRQVWGITLAEAAPDESEEVPGTVPDEAPEPPEEQPEEQPEEEPETVEAVFGIDDLDGATVVALDEYGDEVIARIRVLEGGSLIADQIDGEGKLVRVFDPAGIVDVLPA